MVNIALFFDPHCRGFDSLIAFRHDALVDRHRAFDLGDGRYGFACATIRQKRRSIPADHDGAHAARHLYDDGCGSALHFTQRRCNIKEITPSKESLGYSGVNGTMKTQSGITGEIQVNSPEMIYAKESPANARAILGDETYDAIANRVGVPGGRGHALYEHYRSLPENHPSGKALEQESME